MAIKQTVTFTNPGSVLSTDEEFLNEIKNITSDLAHENALVTSFELGEFSATRTVDIDTQTMVVERIWDETAWNTYKSNYSTNRTTNLNSLEIVSWVCTETEETI